jgi:multidrug efflux system outer membrane protein
LPLRFWAYGPMHWLVLLCALLLAACAKVGPDYTPPPVEEVPAAWVQPLGPRQSTQLAGWWRALEDPALNALMVEADESSPDLEAAAARVAAARAAVGVANAGRIPQVGLEAETARAKGSREMSASVPPPQQRIDTFDTLGAGAAWEVDLFGRVARAVEATGAESQAAVADARGVRVTLYADIAQTYVSLRALQARLAYAHGNAAAQAKTRDLVRHKHEAGLVSELDLRQAERNLAVTRSAIPSLEAGIDSARYRLAVLTGQTPGALDEALRTKAPIPALPEGIIGVVPRDVVRQRPDIRAAERRLAAAVARVGVATADLYPRLSLLGSFTQSAASGPLMVSSASGWSFGPSLTWSVFTGGRVRAQIKAQEAEAEAARAMYEGTVLRALAEVETALSAYAHEGKRLVALERSVQAARKSEKLVQAAYDAGLADFQNVLDAQRALFEQEDAAAASRGALAQGYITIVRAMGGGWQAEQEEKAP